MSRRTDVKMKATAINHRRGRPPKAVSLREATDALYREHIRAASERVFAEKGFAKARMQDIAAEAGVSLTTLYQAHPSKDDLYRQLLEERDAEMLNAVLKRGESALKQPQSIEQVLWLQEASVRFLLEHSSYLRMILHEGHAWYHGAAHQSSVEQQIWERGVAAIKAVLAWGVKQGLMVPGDSTEQARLLISMQQTRLAHWVMGGMDEDHASVTERVLVGFIQNFCVPAVATRMVTADGSRLNDDTIRRIRAFEGGQPRAS